MAAATAAGGGGSAPPPGQVAAPLAQPAAAAPQQPADATTDPAPATHATAWEARAPAGAAGLPLHEALQQLRPEQYPTKTAAKKACRRGTILIDGKPATNPSQPLQGGERLQCVQRAAAAVHGHGGDRLARAVAAAAERLGSDSLRLQVVYEDDHMACVVKPQGVPCDPPPGRGQQPAPRRRAASGSTEGSWQATADGSEGLVEEGSQDGSVASGSSKARSGRSRAPPPAAPCVFTLLAHTLQPSQALGALRRPRHVHRLDEPTGGLLLVAKTRQAQQELGAAFEQRRVTKRYRALAWGRLEGRGLVTYALDGRRCETEYACVQHTLVHPGALGISADALAAALAAAEARPAAAGAGSAEPPAAAAAAASAAAMGDSSAQAQRSMDAAGSGGGGTGSEAGGALGEVWVTTVDLWPHTGRTHQLRRHLALLGHPLLGEPKYSFGYAAQRLRSGQQMAPEDHRKLVGPVAAAAAGEAASAAPAALAGSSAAAFGGVPAAASTAEAAGAVGAAAAAAATTVAPPQQPHALLRVAAAAAQERHAFQLCLWALELQLEQHPVTREPLHFQLAEPDLYRSIRGALGQPTV